VVDAAHGKAVLGEIDANEYDNRGLSLSTVN
jgi:hypothetical protein